MCFSQFIMATEIAPFEGKQAPDFELIQNDGSLFRLSDSRGKQAVYVVFWNTWCSYCYKKIPRLKAVENDFPHRIKIIAINTSREDSVAAMKHFQKKYHINYSLAFDDKSLVSDGYQIRGVPTEFIVDINGIIRHRDGVPKQLSQSLTLWNTLVKANKVSTAVAAKCIQESVTC